MVAVLEAGVVILCAVVGVWWFIGTSAFRSRRRRSATDQPGHPGSGKHKGYEYPDEPGGIF
jgi:hypothetical protein